MSYFVRSFGYYNSQQQIPIDPNLVGWYTFAGNSPNDQTGNGFTLGLISGGTNNTPTFSNQGFRITGNTAFNVGTANSVNTGLTSIDIISGITYAQEVSLMGWAKADAFPNFMSPFGMSINKKFWRIYVDNTANKYPVAQRFDGQISNIITRTTTLDTNWHHYAMVVSFISGQGTMNFYFDGVSQGTFSLTNRNETAAAGTFVNVDGLMIGAAYKFISTTLSGRVNDVWDGEVDDVRFYNDVVTASEITDIYNGGRK